MKKMYEDIIESKEKSFEAAQRSLKTGFANEIEQLTGLFAQTSRELVSTTGKYRKLRKEYEAYQKEAGGTIDGLQKELQERVDEIATMKDRFENFDRQLNEK